MTELSQNIYNSAVPVNQTYIDQFFESEICHTLQQELNFTEGNIAKLLQLSQNKDEARSAETLADFISIILEENLDLSQDTKENLILAKDPTFKLLIEECLLQKKDLKIILLYYCEIIREANQCRMECLESTAEYFLRNENTDQQLHLILLECMYYASEFTTLTDKCMSFAWEKRILVNSGSNLAHGFLFGILRRAEQSSDYGKIFKDFVSRP